MRIEEVRSGLCARLRLRREEIEQTALSRAYAIADPENASDPAYVDGLRTAVSAAIEYGIEAIGQDGTTPPAVPLALLAQARTAARNGVSLDTVLRRYFAGYTLLGDCVIEEAHDDEEPAGAELKTLMRSQAAVFDDLVAAISEEYTRAKLPRRSSEDFRARRIERLLAGELFDAADLGYSLDRWHLSVLGVGPEADGLIRGLTKHLSLQLLMVRRPEETVWAWLGTQVKPDPAELLARAAAAKTNTQVIAIGEPGEGLAGWRLTHRQARAAMTLAARTPAGANRYADVALMACVIQNDVLVASLRALYLTPLSRERNCGDSLRATLRAYFAAGGNVSSAAASLGIKRQTVTTRLDKVETLIGRSIGSCATELDAALRLDELQGTGRPR